MKKVSGTAPGPYLGFKLQDVRLFYYLISSGEEDHIVGLEYVDDVSVHSSDKTARVVEQCKSAMSSNPVSNWATGFWKTIQTWIKNSSAGVFDPDKVEFVLYVTPVKKVGGFVSKLSSAKSDEDIEKILSEIEKKKAKLKTPPPSDSEINFVLDLKFRKLLLSVIRNFHLVCEPSPLTSIRERLDATLSSSTIEKAIEYGIGRAGTQIDEKIRGKVEPLVDVSEFRMHFKAFIKKHDHSGILSSFSDKPTSSEVQSAIAETPLFVRQLELIQADSEKTIRAASDFLRASADRTVWAQKGLIFEDSLDEYNDAVTRRYENIKEEVSITQANSPEEKIGSLIYARCCLSTGVNLENRAVPEHFLSGTLNSLANTLTIGWHPNYIQQLSDSEE